MPHVHASHPEIINRLRRAEGHLRNVVRMIEEGRPCQQLAQQLHAIERAISAAKKTLIHDHIDHCLERAAADKTRDARSALDEFRDITKYL